MIRIGRRPERAAPGSVSCMGSWLRFLLAPFRALSLRMGGAGGGYLCDRCKWDYGDACRRRERPNAKVCPDFKRR